MSTTHPPAPQALMQSVSRYEAEARDVARQIVHALRQRGLTPVFHWFVLTGTPQGLVWLLAILDKRRIAKMDPYTNAQTLHQIRTLVDGRPTLLSNTTGLRYAILLSRQPDLPAQIVFPETFPSGAFPLGVGLHGPLVVSWQRLRNVLVTGMQGSGKSAFLLGAANVALRQGAQLYLADPEQHTFNPDMWNQFTTLPVASHEAGVTTLLQHLRAEIEQRATLFRELAATGRPPDNLHAYNQHAQAQGRPTLPRLAFIAA